MGRKKEHDNFAGGQPCFADRRRHLRLLLPKEAHLSSRIAAFQRQGGSFTAISLVVLVRRRLIGEARAKDSELAATDERGQLIALKAQNILALCVTFSMCAMVVVATVRGDTLYMLLGGVLLLLARHARPPQRIFTANSFDPWTKQPRCPLYPARRF